jgi:DNA modification methylase
VAMYDLGLKYRRQIIWNYENGFSSPRRSLATHYEPILWFSKSDAYAFRELREPYKSTERLRSPITKNGKVWTPHPGGRIAGDVWRVPTLAGRRFRDEKVEHPTQKPLLLTDRIVRHFSDPGEVVLVPFAGSGTECLSAARSGRRFLGIELNAEYVNLARSRIASQLLAHAQAGTLFPRDEAEASEVA